MVGRSADGVVAKLDRARPVHQMIRPIVLHELILVPAEYEPPTRNAIRITPDDRAEVRGIA
jgi:hypothetical protein